MTRTASPARIAANRLNAQKSTGPKTAEGKAKASLNALKHGMRAETLVLPGEDPQEFEQRRADWLAAFGASDPARAMVVERAVHASWRLERCARAEAARLSLRVRHAAARADLAAKEQADALGARLLFEPVARGNTWVQSDPVALERFDRRDRDHPATLVRELQATAQGVDWLLARWSELLESLDAFGTWHDHETYAAARLLGRRPEDSTDDPVVSALIVAAHGASSGAFTLFDAFNQARRSTPGRPVDERRVEARRPLAPASREEARDWLRSLIDSETSRLRSLKESGLDDLAALDLEDATEAARFDDTPAGVLLRRYETACERELRRSLAELQQDEPAPQPSESPAVPPEPPAPEPAPVGSVREASVLPPRPPLDPPAPAPVPAAYFHPNRTRMVQG